MGFIPLLVLIVLGIAFAGSRGRGRVTPGTATAPNGDNARLSVVSWDPERIFIYALSFAGLLATLYAVAGLAATVIVTITQQSNVLIGTSEVRDRTSYYLASIVVGLPVWLVFWRLAQRRAVLSPAERQSRERRLYLAGVFAVASVVALFGLHDLLHMLLTLPGTDDRTLSVRNGIFAGARLLIWGAAWLFYARLGWRERSPRDQDEPHDLAVYVLSGFSLAFLTIGLGQALHEIVGDAIPGGSTLLAPTNASLWQIWGEIAAWTLSGGAVWAAIWRYDLLRAGRRPLRVLYLYVVVIAAAAATLVAGVDILFEILRRLFGYQTANSWSFLHDFLPPLLVGGATWAYHWIVMRQQAAFSGEKDLQAGEIPWPRHPAIALLDLTGLAMAASSFTSLLWLGLDLACNTGVALSGGAWWRDRVSFGLAAGLVGAGIWLSAWSILQRSAAANPASHWGIQIRRQLLGLIVLAGTLIGAGFVVALLWTVFNALLGGSFDAATLSRTLKDLSTALIALAVAAYHGAILRRERKLRPAPRRTLRLLALVAPGAEGAPTDLARQTGRTVELIGRLPTAAQVLDASQLAAALGALEERQEAEGAILIMRPDGVTLYPYTREPVAEPAPSPEPSPPIGDSAVNPA